MHLSRLPSGTWRVIVTHRGRKASATRPTKAEARQAGAELLLELGGAPKASDVTVAELTAAWLAFADLSVTYRADAVRVIDRLPETFTDRRLAEVTPAVVEGLYRQLGRAGWSPHRVGRVHAVLSSSWTLARRYEWATVNPFTAARRPTPARATVAPPTVDQVAALLDRAEPRFRLYLELSAALGARRGEVVGLQWADISDREVIVRRSLAYAPGAGVVVTEGKTGRKGHRVVAIDDRLAATLRAHRVAQVELALASGLPAPLWVFSHDAGLTPWRPDFASREFRLLARKTGNPGVRLHDLRHFVATQLLAAGVPVKTVSDRLGHRQVATTTDRYGHFVPAADREAADLMARIVGRG